MKIKFEIYSPLLDDVETLCKSINQSMKDFGYDTNILCGFRVGVITVELPETETKESIEKKLEKFMGTKIAGKSIWLKEVLDDEKSS